MRPGSAAIALPTVQVDVSPLYGVFAESVLMPVTVPAAIIALAATVVGEMIEHGG